MLSQIVRAGITLMAIALSTPAIALPIVGEVQIDGIFSTNSSSLGSATALNIRNAWTVGGTGDYSSVNAASSEVHYQGFTFSPALSGPVTPLWWFNSAGLTFSFVMDSVTTLAQSATSLQLIGFGTLQITGFDPTPGVWEFATSSNCEGVDCEGKFRFLSGSAGAVPEPGTLALLGLGLLGLGLGGRRRS